VKYSAPVDFLPPPSLLKAVSKALAVLDMIVEPDPWLRYYSYHQAWGPAEDLASMQDGSGDEYSIVFLDDGAAYVRGFGHESPISPWGHDGDLWPGLIDGLPERFDQELVSRINPGRRLSDILDELRQTGYPISE
jgi:hypothetical protein